jgi:hypothetical protein
MRKNTDFKEKILAAEDWTAGQFRSDPVEGLAMFIPSRFPLKHSQI